jgi:hypothetical protein
MQYRQEGGTRGTHGIVSDGRRVGAYHLQVQKWGVTGIWHASNIITSSNVILSCTITWSWICELR